MTKHFLLFFSLFLVTTAGALGQVTVEAQNAAAFKKIDFSNFTYRSSHCSTSLSIPAKITLRNGKYETEDVFFRNAAKKVIYGDVTGDTRVDAIVPVECGGTAGNYVDTEIFVFSAQSGKAKLLASIGNDRLERDYKRYFPKGFIVRVLGSGVRVEKSRIIVDAYADGSNAGPIHIATLTYFMRFATPTLVGKPKQRPSGI